MNNLKLEISNILKELGMPCSIKGYFFVRRAIELAVEDINIVHYVTKKLYPTIAKEFDTTPNRVERAIRHAIEVCCDRGDEVKLYSIFGYTINSRKGKPTNSEFVSMIANDILLNQDWMKNI